MEKVKFKVTLKQLRAAGACINGYNKLVRSLQGLPYTEQDKSSGTWLRFASKKAINLLTILESNGAGDCIWALRAVEHVDINRITRHIACDIAESGLHYFELSFPADIRVRNCIGTARKYADGVATEEQLAAAESAAWSAASDAWPFGEADAEADYPTRAAEADAWYAAQSAAESAAKVSAKVSVWYAAQSAVWYAAQSAAWSAAQSAAWSAVESELTVILKTYLTK